jgi:poly(A) polymerase
LQALTDLFLRFSVHSNRYYLWKLDFSTDYVILKAVEPRIIPRKEHCISRKKVSPNAVRTLYRLHRSGFIAYLVGGCVRDLLLGRTPKDFDIATNATPRQVRKLFHNCFLIGRRFRLAHLHFHDEILEVTTFRRAATFEDIRREDSEGDVRRAPHHVTDEDGMVVRDNLFGTPETDALCRDFTINALAYNIADFSVIDYSTGLIDLEQRLIRPIGDPRVRFTEDPVRMLRAVRFAASHDLVIEPATWETLCELSPIITRAPPARLYEEVQKLFLVGSALSSFGLLDQSGLLTALFPAFTQWLYGKRDRLALVRRNLEYLDRMVRDGTPLLPALLLTAIFGSGLEEEALALHREGIPHQQALEAAYSQFMKEACVSVTIPGKIGTRLRDILALQPFLHRMPPRRPASIVAKAEFAEALVYLRFTTQSDGAGRTAVEWWDKFLLEMPSDRLAETVDGPPVKRRKKRRRRRHRNGQISPSPFPTGTENSTD